MRKKRKKYARSKISMGAIFLRSTLILFLLSFTIQAQPKLFIFDSLKIMKIAPMKNMYTCCWIGGEMMAVAAVATPLIGRVFVPFI